MPLPTRWTWTSVVPAVASTAIVLVTNWTLTGRAETALENSEVSPVATLVAVAVTQVFAESPLVGENEKVALPWPSVVTRFEPIGVCPWPNPEGSGIWFVKNWIRNVVVGHAVQGPLDRTRRRAADGRDEHRVVLEVVRPRADPGLVGRDAAGRVARRDEVDPQLAVRDDAVGEDASCPSPTRPRRPPGR